MIAGFRKYALMYRKAATMYSRDSVPARPVRPRIGHSPLPIVASRPTPAGFGLDMGLAASGASRFATQVTEWESEDELLHRYVA